MHGTLSGHLLMAFQMNVIGAFLKQTITGSIVLMASRSHGKGPGFTGAIRGRGLKRSPSAIITVVAKKIAQVCPDRPPEIRAKVFATTVS